MVGPVVNIGHPGTSQYRVDWSPISPRAGATSGAVSRRA